MVESEVFLIIIVWIPIQFSSPASILFVPNCLSHKRSILPMAKILARKGHNVTIFTSDIKGEKIVNENITDVMLLLSVEQVLAERKIYTWSNFIAKFIEPLGWYTDMCKASVNIHRNHWQLLATAKFDLILLDDFHVVAYELISAMFQSNIADFATGQQLIRHPNHFELPYIISYSPRQDILLNDATNSFKSRVLRFAIGYYLIYSITKLSEYFNLKDAEKLHKTLDLTSRFTHREETRIVIGTNPNELDFTIPVNHKVFSLPLICASKPRGTVSVDLTKFLQRRSKGLIIVSSGHFGRWSPPVLKAFLDAFASLSQYQFVWAKNFDGPVNFAFPNIFVSEWLPISYLLKLRNTKLLITHGGAKTFSESICAMIPMLLFPWDQFSDQANNAALLELRGLGLQLDAGSVSAPTIVMKIKRLINEPKFKKRISQIKSMMTDRLLTTESEILYLAERKIKRENVLKLFSGKGYKLSMWTYLSLDVIVYLFLPLFLAIFFLISYEFFSTGHNCKHLDFLIYLIMNSSRRTAFKMPKNSFVTTIYNDKFQ